jgi:hypothetical protein
MCSELFSQSRTYAPGSPEQLRLEKVSAAVLDWFRSAPDSDVVTILTLGHQGT